MPILGCPKNDVQTPQSALKAYALGWYENNDKKMDARYMCSTASKFPKKVSSLPCAGACDARKGAEKRLRQEKNDKNRIQAKCGKLEVGSVEVMWLNF